MEYKIFRQRPRETTDDGAARALAKQFNLSLINARLLAARGVKTLGEAEEFLHPKLENLYNPFLFGDMDIAAERISEAAERGERVVVYADYDCDGVCAAVIMYKALKKKGIDVSMYLPDRFTDGYGINTDAINRIAESGATLIISVDCGITNTAEIELANILGIDTILTDHHTPPDVLPNAYAIINPKCEGEYYPYKQLCGAGVALKLALALGVLELNEIKELIELAGIATIADLVPLNGENRTLAHLAVGYIHEKRNAGISALIKQAKLNEAKITGAQISFQIAPRINASGRLDTADTAAKLLLETNGEQCARLAAELDSANTQRKKIEEELFLSAVAALEADEVLCQQRILFVCLPDANEGVIGIAAGRLAERYNRPSVIASEKDGIIKASARSIAGFDLYSALNSAGDLYIRFGGHSQAAGFTIAAENFELLTRRVNEYAEQTNLSSLRYKRCLYDLVAVPSQLTERAVLEGESFAPFGIGNPKSIFFLQNVHFSQITAIGNGKHMRANIIEADAAYTAVGFSMGELCGELDEQTAYDVLASASVNEFRNHRTVQLEIKNITVSAPLPIAFEASQYRYFYANLDSETLPLPEDMRSSRHTEDALNDYQSTFFVAFGRDALSRTLKYARELGVCVALCYNQPKPFEAGKINLLLNPLALPSDEMQKIVALDLPCFFGYNEKLFTGRSVEFVVSEIHKPEVQITREYVAFIYKRLQLLPRLGNDFYAFLSLLNTQSEIAVGYFTLRLSLDVMHDMGILSYTLEKRTLNVAFEKISGQKDINSSPIMIKLASQGAPPANV